MKKYWKSLEELNDINQGLDQSKETEPEFSIEGLTEKEVSNKLKVVLKL